MTAEGLATTENLFDFFHECVDNVVACQGAPVSDNAVFYLSDLLVKRGRAEAGDTHETLVELQLRAANGERGVAVQAYKELGDRALYRTGFFRQSLDRGLVNARYYMDMGASAYHRLCIMLSSAGDGVGLELVFEELAETFAVCSDVLQEVRDGIRHQNDAEVLRLYEAWLTTGCARSARRLSELGVMPMRPGVSGEGGSTC